MPAIYARSTLAFILLLSLTQFTSVARESEGSRTNSILLNGTWEFVRGQGDEPAESPAGQQTLQWKQVQLPGPFMPYSQEAATQIKCVWARRTFSLNAAQAASLAVLRWNRIACGAEAFVNGRKVGENEPTGPYQVILPPGALKPGENQIVLKVRGAAGVRKSRSGNALIPAGFGVGRPEVTDDIWLEFADTVYMKWVLAMPDLANSRVKLRVTPNGLNPADQLQIQAEVKSWPGGTPIGRGHAPAKVTPSQDPLGGEHFLVDVPMPGFQPWTYERPTFYVADVTLSQNGRTLDHLTFRFGMREITVKDRNYKLNGKNLWLRGSNLVFEWNWGDTITGHEMDYLVTEAREMSMNSFRTHTQPPPRLWCDIGDQHGTMILAEFPVLYNYQNYKFTPDEYEIWHRNVLTDSIGWMSRMWNHPSVVMWVLSNESNLDNPWEEEAFQDFVNTLDPTRPTMRTGTTGTKDNYDAHACGNITDTHEGNLQPAISGWIQQAGDRTTTCTEYMNFFGHPRTQWTGIDDPTANALAVAQIGAEHTEAMRRARLDGIWPYMYAGWTRTRLAARVRETGKGSAVWKAGFAAPESAAWHSSLSPVLASLDLFDANYRTGQQITNQLHLINDSWHHANVHVDLFLTRQSPEWIPEAECFQTPVNKWSYDFSLPADSIQKTPVHWTVPAQEGSYWLTARITGLPGRPVLSQRFIHAIPAPQIPANLLQRTLVILGRSDSARAFFQEHGLPVSGLPDELVPGKHIVLIWNPARVAPKEQAATRDLCHFADRGGRIVLLSTPAWNWPGLCDIKIGEHRRFSRVFPHPSATNSILAGLPADWLTRWNGLPGTVAISPLQGPAMSHAEKLLWVKEPSTTVAAWVPAAEGGGRILFAQLDIQSHVDRTQPRFDPAAERLLINLVAAEPAATQKPEQK